MPKASSLEDLESFASKLRQVVATSREEATQAIDLSVSIGIARSPDHGVTAGQLLTAADFAMYRAKQQGRGRFCLCGSRAFVVKFHRHVPIRIKSQILNASEDFHGRFVPTGFLVEFQGRFAGPASRNGGFLVVSSQRRADHTVANRHDSREFLRFFLIDGNGHKVGKPYRLSLVTQSNRRCGIKLIRGYWLNRFRKPILESGFELFVTYKSGQFLDLEINILVDAKPGKVGNHFRLGDVGGFAGFFPTKKHKHGICSRI
ncbi:MAG: diguanylate cyclase [Gemmataceae bacterium]